MKNVAATLCLSLFFLGCARQPQPEEQKPTAPGAPPATPANSAAPNVPPPVSAEPLQPLPEVVQVNHDKAALGEKLFVDKLLSANGKIACSNCHELTHGGAE